MSDSFDITYAAHTASCTFLLDADGICRRIVLAMNGKRTGPRAASARATPPSRVRQCIGAQYVASLDSSLPGLMAERPRVGTPMLFARIDERGRVTLVRTGPVTHFEALGGGDDPFTAEPVPSTSVETSAPVFTPSIRTRRTSTREPHPDYDDANERTQPIQAIRPGAFQGLHPEDAGLHRTSEYGPTELIERPTLPSAGVELRSPHAITLRQPPSLSPPPSERTSDPYATHARGVLPRRTEPHGLRRASSLASTGTTGAVHDPVVRRGMLPNAYRRGGR